MDAERFIETVNKHGLAIIGQTDESLAPADKVLYALRDVTGTVDCLPLVVSSILSKKIAAGADVIVLDVKTGSGAIMPTYEKSLELARTMVRHRQPNRPQIRRAGDRHEPAAGQLRRQRAGGIRGH